MHNVNVSQTDLIQICSRDGYQACQPDFNYQEESLEIGDLDGDGSHELISYYTSFVETSEARSMVMKNSNKWHLTSVVKVIRLESELPKLFVSSTKK